MGFGAGMGGKPGGTESSLGRGLRGVGGKSSSRGGNTDTGNGCGSAGMGFGWMGGSGCGETGFWGEPGLGSFLKRLGLGIMIKIRIGMATRPPTPIWFCCNCVQLLGFCCNSGAILVQFWCNSGAIAVAIGRDLPPAWGDTKLAKLIVIGRSLSGSASGRHRRRIRRERRIAGRTPGGNWSNGPVGATWQSPVPNVPFLKGIVKGFF
jgi:hypothetical protein